MIKIDLKEFIRDRIWFGWWYRGPFETGDLEEWVRDPNTKFHWIVRQIHSQYNENG